MATFNKTNQGPAKPNMVNHEGSAVYSLKPLEVLFSQVLGSFFGESTFYEKRSAEDAFKNLQSQIKAVPLSDKEYVLKIAELGRRCNMITYPVEILTACLNDGDLKDKFLDADGKSKMPYYFDQVVRRTKDINDIVATHLSMYPSKGFPAQMRKCVVKKLNSYDAFKLSKGLEENSDVSLADVIKLFHPGKKQIYKDIIEGKVSVGAGKKLIQSELTKKGQTKEKPNEGLAEAVLRSDLGNILRNLMNIHKNGLFDDEAVLAHILKQFRNRDLILRSKILPFRFYSAHKELMSIRGPKVILVMEALEDALDISIDNVDNIDGYGAILVDRSGSMSKPVSKYSSVLASEIAMILGAIAFRKGTADLFVFGSDVKKIDMSRRTPIFQMMEKMSQAYVGGGTDLNQALTGVTNNSLCNGVKYDYLMILSDNDCYGYNNGVLTFGERSWYSTNSSADQQVNAMISRGIIKKVWINNLLGNDFAIVNTASHKKNLITGFSEKFIDIINVYNSLGTGKDIRTVIDLLLEKEKQKAG